jgi:hypothetical protein
VDGIPGTHTAESPAPAMRGLKRRRYARIISAGHAFVQNLRRSNYELAPDVPARHRLRDAFDQLTMAF